MSDTFKIGEVAILQNCEYYPELNGVEVTIMSTLGKRATTNMGVITAHLTDLMHDGVYISAQPYKLRKKRPPQNDTGEIRIRELFNVTPIVKQSETA